MKQDLTYEEAMQALEELTQKMENGQLNIDALAKNLKEAQELIAFCRAQLLAVDKEINKALE